MRTNVLHLIGSFHQGGSERQALQLVSLLKGNNKYASFVACLDKDGVLMKEVPLTEAPLIQEYQLTSFFDFNMAVQLQRCVRFIKDNRISIVQSHDFYTNIFGMAAGYLAGVPVRIAAKRDTGTKTRAQLFLERRAFSLADTVVTNAKSVARFVVSQGIRERKVRTIYNGIDLQRLATMTTDRKSLLKFLDLDEALKLRLVVIVANFRSDVKNQHMFLRAARKVRDAVPDSGFVLAGEGSLIGRNKACAIELGLDRGVFFTGRCSRIAELLAVAEIGVLSSFSEGFPSSILEYMAAGKPVVATRVGGAEEAVVEGETGYLVDSDDDSTMAQRILGLLNNPQKAKEFGELGRMVVEAKFTPASQLAATLNLYDELIAKKLQTGGSIS